MHERLFNLKRPDDDFEDVVARYLPESDDETAERTEVSA